jgi:septum formation protein
VPFQTVTAGVDEDALKAGLLAEGVGARDIADALAEAKAVKVSNKRSGLVIGADQTLEFDGKLYDKARTAIEARERLTAMRGQVHKLHSAVVVAQDGQPIWRELSTASLRMRTFTTAFIDGYMRRQASVVLSAVGGYHLEGEGLQLFDRIDGDYFTILGLPMLGLMDLLRRHGVLEP